MFFLTYNQNNIINALIDACYYLTKAIKAAINAFINTIYQYPFAKNNQMIEHIVFEIDK